MRDNLTRDLSGFSLNCWEEEDDSTRSDPSGSAKGNGKNVFFNIVDDLSEKESECFLKAMKDIDKKAGSKSLDWGGFPDDGRQRKVRFSPELPEVRSIERADRADYPILFYGIHELQKMADEFQLEELNARRHRAMSALR
jgi:hypothetical protein